MNNKFIYELFTNTSITHFDISDDEDKDFLILDPDEPEPHMGKLVKADYSTDILKVYFNKNIRNQYPAHYFKEITDQNGSVVQIVFMVKRNNDGHDDFSADYRQYYLLTSIESQVWKKICELDSGQ